MMGRYPASVVWWQYYALTKRDGEFCCVCKKGPEEAHLEVDHIDGDRNNNSPNNLRLLCHGCNVREYWRKIHEAIKGQPPEKAPISEILSGSSPSQTSEREIITKHDLLNTDPPPHIIQKIEHRKDESVSEIKAGGEGRRVEQQLDVYRESPELRISREKEPEFRRLCVEYVISRSLFTVNDATFEVSEEISLSPITAQRYLKKLTSAKGPLKIGEGPRGHQRLLLREEYWEKRT